MTGFLILKMGQINMNDLQADTSDIIKEILMCVVIAMTGMFGITEYAINRLIAGRISTIATSMLLTYTTVRLIMYVIISTQRNIASDSCPCAAIYALLSDDETTP